MPTTEPCRNLLTVFSCPCFLVAVCIPGYGQQGSPQCTPCNFGSYNPGGGTRCTLCPEATFYPPVDGAGDRWTSQGKGQEEGIAECETNSGC